MRYPLHTHRPGMVRNTCRHESECRPGFAGIRTEPVRKLPPCENCGQDAGFDGPPPRLLNTEPPVPWRYASGLYECTRCRARVALVEGRNALSPCEFCGSELRASGA